MKWQVGELLSNFLNEINLQPNLEKLFGSKGLFTDG
jgi:hypothetical protein